mmetsp:Transcript_23636/g.27144  ORF Transcript_23636/g.27144 Transcript_23636/m.27144 type:complete len:113 (-) Transcript_23636:26-364(-)
MSNYEYPRNLYYEPSENKNRTVKLIKETNIEETKDEEESSANEQSRFMTKINASINEIGVTGSDDESDGLLNGIYSDEEYEHEEEFQQKIKPPIPINWEHIIIENMSDNAKD